VKERKEEKNRKARGCDLLGVNTPVRAEHQCGVTPSRLDHCGLSNRSWRRHHNTACSARLEHAQPLGHTLGTRCLMGFQLSGLTA
jgi:hypothetical protein